MFSLFNISPDNMLWFYLAPVLFFGPVFFAVLWNFGLKNIFHTPPEYKEQRRLEREHVDRITKRRESKAGYYARAEHLATASSKHWVAQAVFYAAFASILGLYSAWPGYRYSEPDTAQIKLSLSHPGKRVEECHTRTFEELAKLAPNMRAKLDCSRERWPIMIELTLDDRVVFAGEAAAAGLHNDGSSSFYAKFRVPVGAHTLMVRMNDAGPKSDFTHELSQAVELTSAQNLVVGFNEDGSGFFVK
jgi:hypothetical protein